MDENIKWNMADFIDYKKLAEDYFSGRITKDDQQKLNVWLRANAANMQAFREWENAWASSSAAKAQTDAAWAKFQSLTSASVHKKEQTVTPLIKPLWRRPAVYWSVAAVMLLLLALPLMRLTQQSEGDDTTLLTQVTEPERITLTNTHTVAQTYYLPDSSLVRLAPGAEVAYMSDYGTNERALQLVGETYFEVTKNPDCHFTVEASDFVVEVIGTHFTIKADSASSTASVELHEGAVQVHYADSTYLLSPGEEITYYKDKRQMRYSRQSLGGLLQRLSRHYRRPILFEDSSEMLQYVRYTFRPSQKLEDILESLSDVYPLQVSYQNDTCIVRLK